MGTGELRVKIAIITPFEGFANDIADVVRLFYGEGAAVTAQEAHDAALVHTHEEQDGQWTERFVLSGSLNASEMRSGQAVTGDEKRFNCTGRLFCPDVSCTDYRSM